MRGLAIHGLLAASALACAASGGLGTFDGGPPPAPGHAGDALVTFRAGTTVPVRDVRELAPEPLNARLGPTRSGSPIATALRAVGDTLPGNAQTVSVREVEPREREAGTPVTAARVEIENAGFLDDAVSGDRTVLLLEDRTGEGLRIVRALHARLCSRPGARFYSARPCP